MESISRLKTSYLFVVVMFFATLVFLAISFLSGEIMSPEEHTNGRLHSLMLRIFDYVELDGEPPKQLEDLPPIPDHDNTIKDGWGNTIAYILANNGDITIVSYGKDGKEGGDGKAADIGFTFDPHDRENYYKIIDVISPSSFTEIKLSAIREKVVEYFKVNQKLPPSLEDLYLDRMFYLDSNKDFWDNEILYGIDRDTVTLKSLGKDGANGGKGENADIITSFKVQL